MDAFRTPQNKTTKDLLSAFLYYMAQPVLLEQSDVSHFWSICEELNKRKFDFIAHLRMIGRPLHDAA